MKGSRSFWDRLLSPPVWAQIATWIVTPLFCGAAIALAFTGFQADVALTVIAYVTFALAALSLGYAVFLLVRYAPRIKESVARLAEKYSFTRSLLRDYGFRTVTFAIGSFAFSFAYAVMNAALGVFYRSVWFGALAAYYIFLAVMRGGILLYHKNRKRLSPKDDQKKQLTTYRTCGYLLLILNVALSAAIAQMIFDNRSFSYLGWTIFAAAAYTFYKITMAIVNLIRARKQDLLTVQAIRNLNFADAIVSLLSLQTALLSAFSEDGLDRSLFNTATGCVVSALTVAIGVFMIVRSYRLTKFRKENTYEE